MSLAMTGLGELMDKYADIEHPIGIPAFIGTALVFVLAFRTNQAYDRWWEARKIWGAIVNDSRSFFRTTNAFILPGNETVVERLTKRQIGWNYILTKRLRKLDFTEHDLSYFSKEEQEEILASVNPNQSILKLQSSDLHNLLINNQIDELHHIEIEEILLALEASMGKAERIKNTQFPVLYDWLIHIAIYFFAALLALAIVDSSHIFEISFTVAVSTIFLALEQISLDLQDPFENRPNDTPMTQISYTIECGALQLHGQETLPPAPKQGKFWVK